MGKRQLPIPERAPWHKTKRGCWSLSLGVRGVSVRVEQREPGGVFYRVCWQQETGSTRRSLRTKDRSEARRLGEQFVEALASHQDSNQADRKPLTLEQLWDLYQREAFAYRRNTKRTQSDKRGAAARLLAGLGTKKRVDLLTLNDVDRYTEMRRTGRGWPDGRVTKPVRANTVRLDLALLRTILLWATRERCPDGSWLLPENPLRGLKLPKEKNPMRPIATYDRFLIVRKAVQQLSRTAPQARGRERWVRFELMLVLIEATGRRIGAIRGLRWGDICFDPPEIRWRAEFDKARRESVVPIPRELADEIRGFKRRLAVIGDGWLFPMKSRDARWPAKIPQDLLNRAERAAGVPKFKGGVWHPYRRKWASERKTMSVVDVMAAGGWKDLQTLLTCYQQADETGMLEVMASPMKLRERKGSTGA